MDYRSSRYMYENQQNIYSLIRLMILQEQNLRYMMSNNRPERTPERNSLNDQLSFLFPSNPISMPPINASVQMNTPSTSINNGPLTSDEILETTTNLVYEDIEEPINTECPITRETFEDTDLVTRINHCGHIFKRANLRLWLSIHSNCPMCRHNLRNDLNTNTNNSSRRTTSRYNAGIVSPTYERLWGDLRSTLDNINNTSN